MTLGTPFPAGIVPKAPTQARPSTWAPPRWLAMAVWTFFVATWVVLGIVMIVSPGTIDEVWTWFGAQSTLLQVVAWIALLPVMIAVAVLRTAWELWLRIGVLVLCVTWTTVGFYPNRIARHTG